MMETKKPSPEEAERQRREVSTAPAPRAVPTYEGVSSTKPVRFVSEPKLKSRREIVKR